MGALAWILLLSSLTPIAQAKRPKFEYWFLQDDDVLVEAKGSCRAELDNYQADIRVDGCSSPCACAADCILEYASGTTEANFASAQVLLGLLPATLVFLSPTIAEVAALSTYRPALVLLVSLASPAVKVSRLFQQIDVREPMGRPMSRTAVFWSAWLGRQHVFVRASLRILMYLVAFGALANNVHNSVYTDLRTISGWRCSAVYMPMIWSLMGFAIHSMGLVAVRLRLPQGYRPSITSVFHSTTYRRVSTSEVNVPSELLFWAAGLSAVVHMTFGVLVLSSLVFIPALDAIQVFLRYAVSALVCQVVVNLELVSLRHELGQGGSTTNSSNDHSDPTSIRLLKLDSVDQPYSSLQGRTTTL